MTLNSFESSLMFSSKLSSTYSSFSSAESDVTFELISLSSRYNPNKFAGF